MSDSGVASKLATRILKREDFAGERLFAEYAKIEESAPSENDRLFLEIHEAFAIPAEIEERLLSPAERDAWTEDTEDEANEAGEEHLIVRTLLEEMSGLEAESEQFEATSNARRENLEHHADDEE